MSCSRPIESGGALWGETAGLWVLDVLRSEDRLLASVSSARSVFINSAAKASKCFAGVEADTRADRLGGQSGVAYNPLPGNCRLRDVWGLDPDPVIC